MTTTKDNFEQVEKSIADAKTMRVRELERFHIGDVVYPVYQPWFPLTWGTVTDIGLTTHKITVDIQGHPVQYEPEELILTSPELKTSTPENDKRTKEIEVIEKKVEKAFKASRTDRLARRLIGDDKCGG